MNWNLVGVITATLILAALLLPVLGVALSALSALRNKFRHINAVLAAVFVIGAVQYGSTKGWIFYLRTDSDTQYIVDRGSFVTNDYIHVDFVKSILVPGSADLQGYYRELSSTNDEDWVQFIQTTFNDFPVPIDIPFPAATNFNFIFFTDWSPSPSVHTNGTATIMWQSKDENTLIPYRTDIYLDGERIAPNHSITNGPYSGSVNLLQDILNEE